MKIETLKEAELQGINGLKQLDEDIEVAREFQQECKDNSWRTDLAMARYWNGTYWKTRESEKIEERIKRYLFGDSEIYATIKIYDQLEEREKLRDIADSISSRLPKIFEKFGMRGYGIWSFADVGLRLAEVLINIYLATDYPDGLERLRRNIDQFGESPRFLEHITYGKTKEDLQKEERKDLPDMALVIQTLQSDFLRLRKFTPIDYRKCLDYINLDWFIQGFWRDDQRTKLIEIGDRLSDMIVDEAKISSPFTLCYSLFGTGKEYDGTHELELMKVIPRAIRAYIYGGDMGRIRDLTEGLDNVENTKVLRGHGPVLFSSLDYFSGAPK